MDWQTLIVAIVASSIIPTALTVWSNRRKTEADTGKTRADADGSVAQTAMAIMKQTLENTVDPLNKRVDDLEAENENLRDELKGQAKTLDEWNAKFVKMQLALVINIEFMKQQGLRPPVDIADVEHLTTEELKDIAMGLRNARQRREDAIARKDRGKGGQ